MIIKKIETEKTSNEILGGIQSRVKIVNNFDLLFKKQEDSFSEYEGIVNEKSFEVRRIVKLGYSGFLPVVKGDIIRSSKVTEITFNIQYNRKSMSNIGRFGYKGLNTWSRYNK